MASRTRPGAEGPWWTSSSPVTRASTRWFGDDGQVVDPESRRQSENVAHSRACHRRSPSRRQHTPRRLAGCGLPGSTLPRSHVHQRDGLSRRSTAVVPGGTRGSRDDAAGLTVLQRRRQPRAAGTFRRPATARRRARRTRPWRSGPQAAPAAGETSGVGEHAAGSFSQRETAREQRRGRACASCPCGIPRDGSSRMRLPVAALASVASLQCRPDLAGGQRGHRIEVVGAGLRHSRPRPASSADPRQP